MARYLSTYGSGSLCPSPDRPAPAARLPELSQEIEAALREAGFDDVRPTAGNVFPFVPPEGITVSALAERARVRKQTMTQAVEQLERAGYVERRPNPRDRRSRLVFLTERGASVPPVTHAAAEGVEGRWAELTSPEELEALRGSLLRLLGQLEARRPGPEG